MALVAEKALLLEALKPLPRVVGAPLGAGGAAALRVGAEVVVAVAVVAGWGRCWKGLLALVTLPLVSPGPPRELARLTLTFRVWLFPKKLGPRGMVNTGPPSRQRKTASSAEKVRKQNCLFAAKKKSVTVPNLLKKACRAKDSFSFASWAPKRKPLCGGWRRRCTLAEFLPFAWVPRPLPALRALRESLILWTTLFLATTKAFVSFST